MPRMQVYLPDELYRAVKKHGLRASELLQEAVLAHLKRMRALAETDRYLAELQAEAGPPSARDLAAARRLAEKIARGPRRKTG